MQMKQKLSKIALLVGVVLTLYFSGRYLWKLSAEPYGFPKYSGDGKCYIQFYSVWTPKEMLATLPGHGSDSASGFIRLYSAKGEILEEMFVERIATCEFIFDEYYVYVIGGRDAKWRLR